MHRPLLSAFAAVAAVFTAFAWSAAPARAEPAQSITTHDNAEGEAYVQNLADRVMGVLNGSQSEQAKEQQIRAMIDGDLDGDAIAKYTLKALWKTATSAEFTQFVALLKEYASSFYQGRLNEYSGAKLKVTGSQTAGKTAVVVGSTILNLKNSDPIYVDWLVIHTDAGYKLIDFRFSGVWIARSWGDQFASIIDQNGGKFQALNDHLKEQIATGKKDIH